MFALRRKYGRRSFGSKKTYKTSGRKGKFSSVKKVIRSEISRNLEKKSKQYEQQDDLILGSANSLTLDATIVPLAPDSTYLQIDQGVGNGSRVGNSITTKKLTFKGTLVPLPYNVSTNPEPRPVQIKLWVFYDKTRPTEEPTPAQSANFFQFNNSAAGFSNDLVDLWRPINTDVYRVVATRTFKLGVSRFDANGTVFAGSSYFANNDFKYNCNFSIDLTKHIPKIVKFNDTNSQPTSRGLFSMFVAYYADGTAMASGVIPAKYSWMLDYTYTDA